MRLVILIVLLIPYFLLGGCLSMSASSGGKAETGASAGASGSSNVGTSDTNEMIVEKTTTTIDDKGKPVVVKEITKLNSGSRVSNTNEQNAVAEASAKASSEAVAKGMASANGTIFMLLIGVGILFLIKMWDKIIPIVVKFIK